MIHSRHSLLRSIRRLGAAAALVALVLAPAWHAPHGAARSAPAITAGSNADAPSCPLCVFVSHARSATPSSPVVFAPVVSLEIARARVAAARDATPFLLAAAPPRAPPA